MRRSVLLLLLGLTACASLELEAEKASVGRAIAARAAVCDADESVDMVTCMRASQYLRIETPACPKGASRRQLRNPDCWDGLVRVAAK